MYAVIVAPREIVQRRKFGNAVNQLDLFQYVDITINGEEIDLKMKLGENGVAFFTEPTTDVDVPEYLVTSPVPGSSSTPVDGKVSQ